MGKGSGRRPGTIPDGAWERIFGNKENNQKDSQNGSKDEKNPPRRGEGKDTSKQSNH